MRRRALAEFASSAVLALSFASCMISNYPVIRDSRGADENGLVTGQYEAAYIVPSGTFAIVWDDGSDELFTLVSQDWNGDQRLDTYDNFDPTASVLYLDQLYCDPVFGAGCAAFRALNPNLPDWWGQPHEPAPPGFDNVFDYEAFPECNGFRSMEWIASCDSRIGECGSGIFADKQALAYEFSQLARTTWRGAPAYQLALDDSLTTVRWIDGTGDSSIMPLLGRFNLYLDERLRAAFPVSPNLRYELLWIQRWVAEHGPIARVEITYGSLVAAYRIKVRPLNAALDRL
jgi:hypothetical protein